MHKIIERVEYSNRLKDVKEKNVIKIITGIRRCGKSVLLSQFQDYLKQNGASIDQIVSLNFEELKTKN
jgi:predicted AAA+ superfamily ATPase